MRNDELLAIQKRNLAFVEGVFGGLGEVAGVPILRALGYDLIQVLNNLALAEALGEDGEQGGKGAEEQGGRGDGDDGRKAEVLPAPGPHLGGFSRVQNRPPDGERKRHKRRKEA